MIRVRWLLLVVAGVALAQSGIAQIENLRLVKLDESSFQEWDRSLTKSSSSGGFSFAPEPQAIDNIASEAEDYDELLRVGDYVIICFTPRQRLHVRLIDVTPAGRTHQLYPDGNETVVVEGGATYCLGDPNSTVRVRADEESGTGVGSLWLLGSPGEEMLATADDFALPYGFDTEAAAGTLDITPSATSDLELYEGWIKYRIY